MMKIAIAQIEIINSKPQENFQHLSQLVSEAIAKGCTMIVFSELCLSGHLLNDLWFNEDFTAELTSYNEKICSLSSDIIIVWGNILKKGKLLYNAAFIAQNGKYLTTANSQENFVLSISDQADTFCDIRYFQNPNTETKADYFVVADGSKVCLIAGQYHLQQQKLPETTEKVDIIVNIVNSPYRLERREQRAKVLQTWALAAVVIYCNNLGLENNGKNFMVYDGDCQVYDQGQLVVKDSGEYVPALLIEKSGKSVSEADELIKLLIYALRAFDRLLLGGQMKWVVGLSGGLDSSISAALLTLALGKDKVLAYNLPTVHNSEKTINNARQLAQRLGIEYHEVAIDALVTESRQAILSTSSAAISGLTDENIQARIRGHLLSSFAAHSKAVIINNGNKLELALGYYTLYGDSIGALALLGDLLKMELFELAQQINHHCQKIVIPENLIPKLDNYRYSFEVAPSAELKREQVDPMKWGYHDLLLQAMLSPKGLQLEELLRQYRKDGWAGSDLGKWRASYFDNETEFVADLRWFLQSLKSSVFKRVQSIPLLSLTDTSFGGAFWENQGGVLFSAAAEELLNLIAQES